MIKYLGGLPFEERLKGLGFSGLQKKVTRAKKCSHRDVKIMTGIVTVLQHATNEDELMMVICSRSKDKYKIICFLQNRINLWN